MADYLAKLTAKGQMTLPHAVRKALGVKPGDHVQLEPTKDGAFLMRAGSRASELAGIIPYDGPARTVEEIRAASRATFGE
jgi:AbrB family looped-hinge helix DNA binding protein